MNQITGIVRALLQGMLDSITGTAVVFYLDREVNKKLLAAQQPHDHLHHQHGDGLNSSTASSKSRRPDGSSGSGGGVSKTPEKSNVLMRVLNCCLLNGGVFWVSINLFEYGLLPVLKLALHWLFGAGDTGNASYVWSWMQPFLSLLFGMVWVLPLFILSRVVNSLWFQDIANSAYKFRKGRPQTIGISKLIADTLFSLVVQLLFLVQSMAVQLIPMQYVGEALSFVHMCLLYSLYSFEYKWFNMGWELHKRLTYIEYNWPYFIGFGVPLAVLTQLPSSYIVSGCVFAILFPFFILSANEASPTVNSCSYPLKLFSPVVAVANGVFSKTVDPHSRHQQPPPPPPPAQRSPGAPPPSARHSISHTPGFTPGVSSRHAARLPQTVHGVDMSSFLSAAAASAVTRTRSSHRGSPAPSSSTASSSHRSSPAVELQQRTTTRPSNATPSAGVRR